MELIRIENDLVKLDESVSKKIADFEKQIKELKEQEEEIKQAIIEQMELNEVIKLDTDELTITYIAPTERETFDSKSFRKDHPQLFDAYIQMTHVKSSVRIKVK